MDSASRLVRLHQGNYSIEEYVADFCKLSYQVDFKESFLKDIFWFGLSKDISRLMSLNNHHWTLEKYVDFALLLAGSPSTVGVVEEEHSHSTVPATSELFCVPTIMSGVVHVMPAKPQSTPIMPAKPRPKSTHVMPVKPKLTHAMPVKPSLFISCLPSQRLLTSCLPSQRLLTSCLPSQCLAKKKS